MYPLGDKVSYALMASACAAMAATIVATMSCRFVTVSFTSSSGGLEDYFASGNRDVNETPTQYTAGVGLYQWLRPNNPEATSDWSEGACAGYQETMLASISDQIFEVARTFSVFAIIMSVVETCWVFFTSCFEMNKLQVIMFCGLSAIGTISTAMTFLFPFSSICQTEFEARECTIDQGGLIMIGAVVLWLITFCLSAFFVYPAVVNATSDFAKQDARDKAKLKKAKKKQNGAKRGDKVNATVGTPPIPPIGQSYSYDSQKTWTKPIPSRSSAVKTPSQKPKEKVTSSAVQQFEPKGTSTGPSLITVDDVSSNNAMEVYISKRLNRIERISEC